MDRYQKNQYMRERRISNPSFSSTLLDAIYRSIDGGEAEELEPYRDNTRKKHTKGGGGGEEDVPSLPRSCMIEKWMEKKVVLRRNSIGDFNGNSRYDRHQLFVNWSSSSSDSSCGGEADSVAGSLSVPAARSSVHNFHKPKPIRTQIPAQPEKLNMNSYGDYMQQQRQQQHKIQNPEQKHEGSYVKTKSKAWKIYGDLKKVKPPISPGGKLTNFINSLFSGSTANAKKAKRSSNNASYDDSNLDRKSKSTQASTCSSASSYSRSCLNRTPPSTTKSSHNNGAKRLVRFYPVSVVVDEHSQPCGHKSLYEDQQSLSIRNSITTEELKIHAMEKNRRIEEAARDLLLKNYQKKKVAKQEEFEFDEEDEGEDGASCESSDLFELDNLSSIGIERYCEELPVYETTHLGTNRAIANGLIM